jgi:hypothetical protein
MFVRKNIRTAFIDFYRLLPTFTDYAFTNNVSHCCKSQGNFFQKQVTALAFTTM